MPIRGFSGEADAYGFFAAHKDRCKRPVEYAPGQWEVPDGSKEITEAPLLKSQMPVNIPHKPGQQPQVPSQRR